MHSNQHRHWSLDILTHSSIRERDLIRISIDIEARNLSECIDPLRGGAAGVCRETAPLVRSPSRWPRGERARSAERAPPSGRAEPARDDRRAGSRAAKRLSR
eukprot:6744901-Prymnesium_polylepis.2